MSVTYRFRSLVLRFSQPYTNDMLNSFNFKEMFENFHINIKIYSQFSQLKKKCKHWPNFQPSNVHICLNFESMNMPRTHSTFFPSGNCRSPSKHCSTILKIYSFRIFIQIINITKNKHEDRPKISVLLKNWNPFICNKKKSKLNDKFWLISTSFDFLNFLVAC